MNKNLKKEYFTVIIDVYYGLNYFKISLNSILKQTYKKIEIVIINNGAAKEISNYIQKVSKENPQVKVLNYQNNIYEKFDTEKRFDICFNEALKVSNCEYIYYQAYDDFISNDYLKKMANLLKKDECITASGLLISVDEEGKTKDNLNERKILNARSKYINGGSITIDNFFNNFSFIYSSNILHFAFKREALNKVGGFHRSVEQLIYFFILPQGSSGYDETAVFFYRNHSNQANLINLNSGVLGVKDSLELLRSNKNLFDDIWDKFPRNVIQRAIGRKKLFDKIEEVFIKLIAQRLIESLYSLNFRAMKNIFSVYKKENFYFYIFFYLFNYKSIKFLYYKVRNKFSIIRKNDEKFKKFLF